MLLEITSTIVFIILASTQIIRYPSLRTFWMFLKLPMPMSFPIVGPICQLMFLQARDVGDFFTNTYIQKYKTRMAGTWLLGNPMVILLQPDDVKEVLGSPNHTNKGFEYNCLKTWLNEGLLTSNGQKWQDRRKRLTPTFHFKILEGNLGNFGTYGRQLVRSLLDTKGKTTSVQPLLHKVALDIICETAMNIKLEPDDVASAEYVNAIRKVSGGLLYRMLNYYLNRDWIWDLTSAGREYNRNLQIVHSFTEKVIAQRRKELQSAKSCNVKCSDRKTQPFLDKLIELDIDHPGTLSDNDIREEVDTFMFVGYDSTSGTMGFILWELGMNEEIQEKVFNELDDVFGESDREMSMEDLQKMPYLEMVIKEGMRLYPAAPYTSRGLTQDLILRDSTVLAAGFNVVISPYYLHRNPNLYPDPHVFNPERFSPAECAKRHPYAYIPFSAGPRSCLGQKFAMMEMKVLLSTVLRYCRIESVSKREDVVLVPLVVLTANDPILVKIHSRRPI